MFAKEVMREIKRWPHQASSPQHQLDWRWIERLRELDAFDAYWWWAHAGPFTEVEQQHWDEIYTPNPDEAIKEQLAHLIAQSRERELTTAVAEQRQPRLCYPALDIEEVRRRIAALLQLSAEIAQEEPNALVRRLYHEKIEEEVSFLRMTEATYERDGERFRQLSRCVYPGPTSEEVNYVLSRVWGVVQQGLHYSKTTEVSQQLMLFMREHLRLPQPSPINIPLSLETQQTGSTPSSKVQQLVTAQAAKRFFETALRESGFEGWQVVIDKASTTRVESGLRRLILADSSMSVERVRYYFIHELGGHVARSMAGERSPLGLLGIGTKNYAPTEEGLALYHERHRAASSGQEVSDWGTLLGTLSTGLASGVVTPPQTFLSLYTFLELFFLLRRLLYGQDSDMSTAQKHARKTAMANCLRTYRGVPDLEQKGVCLTKDAIYLRGLWLIEQAVAQDEAVLDRLAVGKTALEYLPALQELGIVSSPQPLAKFTYMPDLDTYILSFEVADEQKGKASVENA